MKYCERCQKELDTKETLCPLCGGELKERDTKEKEISVTVATMTTLGLL